MPEQDDDRTGLMGANPSLQRNTPRDHDLVPVPKGMNVALARVLSEEADEYRLYERAPRTMQEYEKRWQRFCTWAQENGYPTLPTSPSVVEWYLVLRIKTCGMSTLMSDLAAIRYQHVANDFPSPTNDASIQRLLSGIRRRRALLGQGKKRRVHPVTLETLQRILEKIPSTLRGTRDRAIFLLGFTAALRRSEIVAALVEHVRSADERGVILYIPRSKGDQEGEGAEIAVPFGQDPALCPVGALTAWLQRSGLKEGHLFRPINRYSTLRKTPMTTNSIALLIKEYVSKAGIDPTEFSGHSLRAGLVTSAVDAGAALWEVARVTRHKDLNTLRDYIRIADQFRRHPATIAGL